MTVTAPDPPARSPVSGWFAVEGDGVVHGWVRDKDAPGERLQVAIAIDGTRIATARADRFVATLLEQGESDGFSGFACAVPPAWRDGQPHEVTAEVVSPRGQGVPLRSKRAGFTQAAGTPRAGVTLVAGDETGVEGTVTGPRARETLDLWIGGRQVAVTPDWRWEEGAVRPFRLDWPGGVVALAAEGAVLAYPGTIEAGLPGSPVARLLDARVRPGPDEQYRLVFTPRCRLPEGSVLDAVVTGAGEGSPLALRLEGGKAGFVLPDAVPGAACTLQLIDLAGHPLGEPLPFTASALRWRMIPNADLSHWQEDGPVGFEAADGTGRGFHAFPAATKAERGLSGHLALVPVGPMAGSPLLAHSLPPLPEPDPARIGVELFARASVPVALALRLERAGQEVARAPLAVGTEWKPVRLELPVPADPRPLRLALVRDDAGAAARLEVAGFAAGAPDAQGFGATAGEPAPAPAGADLVRNAALTRWPDGLVVEGTGTRLAIAEGWAVTARDPVAARAAALPAPGRSGAYGLALSLPAGTPGVALEVELDAGTVAGAGWVDFHARLGAEGSRFGLLDRISLVRRRLPGGDNETVVAVVARKLALGRQWDAFHLPFLCRPAAERRFAATDEGWGHWLRFELHQAFPLELHGLGLVLGAPDAPPAAPPPPLAFEDPAIRAQLGELKGLDGWRSPAPLRPGPAAAPPRPAAVLPRRWSWSPVPGTVEVGIPVHGAADETLACLAALATSTGVPHLVHLLDDGSGADVHPRLAAFVADRPWMRLSTQERRGYTAAANRLVGGSAADWVVLLNSDTIVTAGWLEGLLAAAAGDHRTALVGPVSNAATFQSVPEPHDGAGRWAVNPLPPGWEPEDMAALVRDLSEAEHPAVPLLNGFCTLIRRAAFDAVGGFDERHFPVGYGEENDLCLRLVKAGWRLRVADDVYVWHAKSASFGAAARADLSKAGDKALRLLHPDVDLAALGRAFLVTPALARLRERVRAACPQATVPVEAAN